MWCAEYGLARLKDQRNREGLLDPHDIVVGLLRVSLKLEPSLFLLPSFLSSIPVTNLEFIAIPQFQSSAGLSYGLHING